MIMPLLMLLAALIGGAVADASRNRGTKKDPEPDEEENTIKKFSSGYDFERGVYWTLEQKLKIRE